MVVKGKEIPPPQILLIQVLGTIVICPDHGRFWILLVIDIRNQGRKILAISQFTD